MNIIGCEFDKDHYPTSSEVLDWIQRNGEYANVLKLRGFHLRVVKSSDFSFEKRNVWKWNEPLWAYGCIRIVRPTRWCRFFIQESNDVFTTEAVPAAFPETLEKIRKAKEKERKKKEADLKKKEQRRVARVEKRKREAMENGETLEEHDLKMKLKKVHNGYITEPPAKPKRRPPHLFKKKNPVPPVPPLLPSPAPVLIPPVLERITSVPVPPPAMNYMDQEPNLLDLANAIELQRQA